MHRYRRTAALALLAMVGCTDELGTVGPGGLLASEMAVLTERFGTVPATPPPEPSNNVADDAGAATLGHKLFFETRYSSDGQVSCATCHNPNSGYQDDRNNTALGLDFTGRHTPTALGAAFARDAETDTNWMFWDGRKDSQWSQALGPPENAVEMGGSRVGIAYLLWDHYRAEYEAVFGAMPELRDDEGAALYPETGMPGTSEWDSLTDDAKTMFNRVYSNFGKAIDAYERRLVSRESTFDTFYEVVVEGGVDDRTILAATELRGLRLFVGKAGCAECHTGVAFSDAEFHNTGLRQEGPHLPAQDRGRDEGVDPVLADVFNCAGEFSDHPNKSACAVSQSGKLERVVGGFKTPTLRNIADTGPYMHTGMFNTLEEVVDFYNDGGHESGFSGTKADEIVPLNLTDMEKTDLVAFLHTLSGESLPSELTSKPALPE